MSDHEMKYGEDYKDLQIFFEGERAVKAANERFTPRLEGQKNNSTAYQTYKEMGILFNSLSRTRQGLKGAILRKPIDIQFPESQKPVLDDIMLNGASFDDMAREVCDLILGYGRNGILVDIDQNEKPYAAIYSPMSILKYPEIKRQNVGQEILLQEIIEVEDEDNAGETKQIEQRRKLEIDSTGKYLVTVYQKGKGVDDGWLPIPPTPEVQNPKYPVYKGKKLDFIPFVFFGSSSNTPEPSRPPLLDLLNILKGHWRMSVSYYYAVNFAGLPTACFSGFSFEDGQTIPLGPGVVHHSSDPGAKSWFLQTGGEGLASIEKALDRLEKQMAIVGARLLETQRPGVEAEETVRLRSSGDSASLADISKNIGDGLTDVLRYVGFWLGIPPKECSASLSKDFLSTRLSSQDITALLGALQAGAISTDTFIFSLQQGEILPDGRTIEEEKELIGEDKIANQKNAPNLNGLAGKFL